MAQTARGRPRRYSEYDRLLAGLPRPMKKRPSYLNGIGVFRGQQGDTAWIKIRLPHGGTFNGRSYTPGKPLEIKLGSLSSWTWEKLEARHSDLQGRADRGEPLEDVAAVGFTDWAQNWLGRAKVRVKDYESLDIHVRKHLLPSFGAKALNAITVNDVNQWAARQRTDLAPGTVKRQMNTLKAILNDAQRHGHLDTNPCRNADPIRGAAARQRFLDGEELTRLLVAARATAEWLPDFIIWSLHSGMRKGEVGELQWSDIRTLDDRQIAMLKTSKNDKPRMVICTRAMTEVLERQLERKLDDDDRVFPVTKMTLRRKWEKARKAAGIDDVTMHDLRRTHSTYAAAAGVDLNTLAERIGHTDLTMLQKHYAAIVGSAAMDAANPNYS